MLPLRLKLIKIVFLEFIQWAAFASTTFVTAQKLATVYSDHYWVVVAISIGYVAALTLIVWIPVKLFFQWKKWWVLFENQWCPSLAVYFTLCVIPCCVMPLVGISINHRVDFQSVCAELLVIMLLVVDIAEKLKNFRLRSDDEGEEEVAGLSARSSGIKQSAGGYSMISTRSSFSSDWKGKHFVWIDQRPVGLFENFLAAYDVRLVLGMADMNLVDRHWYFAVYLVTVASMATFILTKQSKYKVLCDVVLMDIPFFFLRISILCIFTNITNVLFLLKNLAFIAIFFYFWAIRPNVFKQKSPRQITVNTVDSTLHNGVSQNVPVEIEGNHHDYEDRSRADTFDDFPDDYEGENDGLHHYASNHEQQYQHHQQVPQYHEEIQQHHNPLVHQDSNEISVHYSLDRGNSYENTSEDLEVYDNHRDDSDFPQNDQDDTIAVGPHQIRRITKKSSRKSIIKTNVFSPPEKENIVVDHDGSVAESPYAIITKPSSKRKSPPLPTNQKDIGGSNQHPSTSHFEDELPPPPKEFHPTLSEQYTVGPHRYSLRNSQFTPQIAAQIAHEVVAVHHNVKNESDDDEELDVQL